MEKVTGSSENDLVNRVRGEAFVGRRDEVTHLASVGAEVAGSGRGQMVVIAGDAGVGKSRLVQEFSDRVSRDGWTTAAGGCVDVAAGALTYAALIEILRHLDRHLGREVMARLADAGIDDLAPLLPGPSSGQPGAGGRLLERMLDYLVRLGDVAPAVVVVEDLHWADNSTRDLIAFLARNIHAARVLLIVTYRADDLHRRHPLKSLLAELERGDASWIRLAGLARPDVAELVAKTAGAAAVQSVSLLFDRTAGNPFFIEELLAASTPVISLPEGLRELLLARLHDLPDSALAVLRPASVLGQGFTEDLLGAATGLPLRDGGRSAPGRRSQHPACHRGYVAVQARPHARGDLRRPAARATPSPPRRRRHGDRGGRDDHRSPRRTVGGAGAALEIGWRPGASPGRVDTSSPVGEPGRGAVGGCRSSGNRLDAVGADPAREPPGRNGPGRAAGAGHGSPSLRGPGAAGASPVRGSGHRAGRLA